MSSTDITCYFTPYDFDTSVILNSVRIKVVDELTMATVLDFVTVPGLNYRNLPMGRYGLFAYKTGWSICDNSGKAVDSQFLGVGGTPGGDMEIPIPMTTRPPVTGVFHLWLRDDTKWIPPVGEMSGYYAPIPGASVRINRVDTDPPGFYMTGTTNSEGRVDFNVVAGTYYCQAQKTSYLSVTGTKICINFPEVYTLFTRAPIVQVTLADDGHGSVQYSIGGGFLDYTTPLQVLSGSTIGIKAIPDTGYVFNYWETVDSDLDVSAAIAYPFISVTKFTYVTYKAHFKVAVARITLAATAGGTIDPAAGSRDYNINDTFTVRLTPASGYHIKDVKVQTASSTSAYPPDDPHFAGSVFSMKVVEDCTVTAEFAQNPPPGTTYTLTVQAPVGTGTMSPEAGTFVYQSGVKVPVTVTPGQGYALDYWTLDSVKLSTSSTTVDVLMDNNHSIQAHLSIVTGDTLVETYKGYEIWHSDSSEDYYVKKSSGEILHRGPSVSECKSWIDSQAPSLGVLPYIIGGGIIGLILWYATKKKN